MVGISKADAISKLRSLKRRAGVLVGNDDRLSPRFYKWLRDTEVTLEHIFGDGSRHLRDFKEIRYQVSYSPVTDDVVQGTFDEGLERAESIIQSMIDEIRQYWTEDGAIEQPRTPSDRKDRDRAKPKNRRVFVVHGHDETMKQTVARTLERLNLEPVILHEQPNKGRTIIEKFTDYSDVSFAVVLMSPDDAAFPAGTSPGKAKPRARQNVIMELGFFIAKLGRERVLPLYRGGRDFEIPSDYAGVVYTPYDEAGHWRFKLVQELKACGFDVDANKLL